MQEVRGKGEERVEVLVFCILYILLGSPPTLQAVQVRGGRVKGVDALVYYTYLHMCMYVLCTYVVYIDNVHKIMLSYYQVLVCGSKWGVENV